MQRKFACSKCSQCKFTTIDDLETHIVIQHFREVDGVYECLYPKCSVQFPTEIERRFDLTDGDTKREEAFRRKKIGDPRLLESINKCGENIFGTFWVECQQMGMPTREKKCKTSELIKLDQQS
ncbi:hypothetical protein Ddc_13755 [Ditylenchus destructor]|nr:hypothetical protein Ddc_13755 [Ditylenchus destructor]